MRKLFLLIIAALITGCGSTTATPTSATAAGTSAAATTTSSTTTLTVSPSSISLSEGQAYTFTGLGGSNSGYTFTMGNGGSVAGTITTSGTFQAASGWAGTTYVILTDSVGDAAFATIVVSGSSTVVNSSAISISPSSISLTENQSYTFTASGGSGTGYFYSVPSGIGSISSSTGLYVAPSSSGSSIVEVVDSLGNIAYASVTIASNTVYSMTATLLNCEGVTGGSGNRNNWQINGSQLRTINDSNNYTESPVYCMGLSAEVPAGATIQGVYVEIFLINQSSTTDGSLLQSLNLIYSGGLMGSQKNLNLAIPGNKATYPNFNEGGNLDTWGAALTSTIVNDPSFGIDIQTYRGNDRLFTGVSGSALPQVTIWYTL
jgi:hypothetical protein